MTWHDEEANVGDNGTRNKGKTYQGAWLIHIVCSLTTPIHHHLCPATVLLLCTGLDAFPPVLLCLCLSPVLPSFLSLPFLSSLSLPFFSSLSLPSPPSPV